MWLNLLSSAVQFVLTCSDPTNGCTSSFHCNNEASVSPPRCLSSPQYLSCANLLQPRWILARTGGGTPHGLWHWPFNLGMVAARTIKKCGSSLHLCLVLLDCEAVGIGFKVCRRPLATCPSGHVGGGGRFIRVQMEFKIISFKAHCILVLVLFLRLLLQFLLYNENLFKFSRDRPDHCSFVLLANVVHSGSSFNQKKRQWSLTTVQQAIPQFRFMDVCIEFCGSGRHASSDQCIGVVAVGGAIVVVVRQSRITSYIMCLCTLRRICHSRCLVVHWLLFLQWNNICVVELYNVQCCEWVG